MVPEVFEPLKVDCKLSPSSSVGTAAFRSVGCGDLIPSQVYILIKSLLEAHYVLLELLHTVFTLSIQTPQLLTILLSVSGKRMWTILVNHLED